ncbi:P-loop containing nucleoside triphosphate hydrolase protein [Protomyces lactucae-debilis]|uniref:p-loop containing nucleoside triphosphate hydrolase protein n=1 Tax=Protomyces lactucae-debilis TaxID=2754530 RepID=A0A1Y2FRL0_PROLT|nr:P-loop containing nucleoside triphosphate hydrolase protein [Protomyces lactucae-debilis]ORY86217.1 P-loop containing nucleoside triphosphate hydrolase protein [Protomyces lactucae-debilis]
MNKLFIGLSRVRPSLHYLSTNRSSLAGTATKFARSAVTLRPYQEECIQSCITAIQEGKRRIAVSLATGSGKTVIFTHLIERVPEEGKRTQTLILVHRKELADQAAGHCSRTYPEKRIELEMGTTQASGTADITVCSVQSLIRRLDKFDPSRVKLILIDEAHHAAAASYLDVLAHFGADTPESNCIVIGVSATLSRTDGLQLGSALDHIVYHRDYVEMIKDNWLCPVKFTQVKQPEVNLKKVALTKSGEFNAKQLAKTVNTTANNLVSVRSWMNRCARQRRSTIVFAVDIGHVNDLTDTFRQHGYDARAVTSYTSKADRINLVDAFRRGDFPVLVNCGIFTEGFDLPEIDCVMLCRPTRSRGLLVQMIGRGMRKADGKADCHVLDLTSCLENGVVSLPTLYGLDPNELLDAEELSLEELERRAAALLARREAAAAEMEALGPPIEAKAPPTAVTYFDYDNVEDLLNELNSAGGRHISTLSQLNWVQVDANKYILSLGKRGFIRVQPCATDETLWMGTETRNLPFYVDAILSKPKVLFERMPGVDGAIAAASTYAVKCVPRSTLLKNAPWRSAEASDAQKKLVAKLAKRTFENRVLSKGEAADFITRFKHGMKGSYAEHEKVSKQQAKIQERQDKLDAIRQDQIVVGPMTV